MSLVGKLGGAVKGAIGGFLTGGVPGAVVGAGMGALGSTGGGGVSKVGMVKRSIPPLPGGGAKTSLPKGVTLGGVGGMVAGGARAAGAKVAAAARGAATMCAKYPQWCIAAGGVAAIAGMMHSGQLPVPKRRRRRGITPRDLQSFRRVATLIKSYGPTARRVPSSCAPRKTCKR